MISYQRTRNEEGAVLVVALMILILLTILGVSISSTSTMEIEIAGNEMRYKENIYGADAAAMECAQVLEQTAEIDVTTEDDFILPATVEDDVEDLSWVRSDNFWEGQIVDPDNSTDEFIPGTADPVLDPDGNSRYMAVFIGLPAGEDFDSDLVEFTIYGRSTGGQGSQSIVKMGYRRVGGMAE